jgi:hypothetical protein
VRALGRPDRQLAPQAIGWFPAGTGPDIGKTERQGGDLAAKAEFDKGMTNFNEAAKAFQAARRRRLRRDQGGPRQPRQDLQELP